MQDNLILIVMFIAICFLTLAVIKLYSELEWLKQSHNIQEEYNIKLFKLIDKEIKELKGGE